MSDDRRPLPEPPPADATDAAPRAVTSAPMIDVGPSTKQVLVAVTIALALVVVAIVVGRQLLADAEPPVHPEYRYLVAGLDAGWRPVAAKDQGVSTGPPFPGAAIVLLGTAGDPTRPAIELVWRTDDGAPTYSDLAASSGMASLHTAGGRLASCADQVDGTVLCYVDERERGLQLRAHEVSRDEIRQVVDALSFEGDTPRLDTAALPGDLQQLAAGRLGSTKLVPNGNADHPGVSSVVYAGPGGASALLVVGDAERQEPSSSAVTIRWERRTVGGQQYFVTTGDGSTIAMWRLGGKSFWLRQTSTTEVGGAVDALLALAATVRPASETEWSAIPVRPRFDGEPIATG